MADTSPTLSLADLESRLWEAANSLRGPVDPADFKAYVFPILFFKRVSDTWDLEHAHALADFGDACLISVSQSRQHAAERARSRNSL